ncbi:MAG: acetolactate synthase 3 large subunit, partial [Alphaproteobacteria bacterium]|nr:acetolactate synthase 3 large subunit [Alphaproteobacteria bacterium]
VGARFDDRITGRPDKFSPNSKKIQIDIDPSSINKVIRVEHAVIGDCNIVLEQLLEAVEKRKNRLPNKETLKPWWQQIGEWRARKCLDFDQDMDKKAAIKPQYAISRLYELTKDIDTYITTEVGQHQMWAAQYYPINKPFHWMTSGGLGTMGYGMPAAIGVQMANPDALVIDIAGEASILMNMQEINTAVQYELPVKIFILNNQYMGMVRQWQELLHGGRYAHSYCESLPDFVKLAEAYHAVGLRANNVGELDDVVEEMKSIKKPMLIDVRVEKQENCYPMIPSGAAHNEMLLNDKSVPKPISKQGRVLV